MKNIEINANNIKNESIAKLDRFEIGTFGLVNCGVYTYKGTLKSRVKGLKTTKNTEIERWFESEDVRWEAIKIVSSGEEDEYAIRLYNKKNESYEEFYQILIGCSFMK